MSAETQGIRVTDDDRTLHYRTQGWWTDETPWDHYRALASSRPTALAVADDRGVELTHRQLLDTSGAMAVAFAEAGLRTGDLVVQIMPNRAEWQVAFVALLRLGARPMTIPITTDQATLTYLCDLTQVRAIVTSPTSGSIALADMVCEAAAAASASTAVIVVDDPTTVRTLGAADDTPVITRHHDVAHVMTTSSTTGRPKAVIHSDNTLAALNIGFEARFDLSDETPVFMPSPLGHSVGSIHGARLALSLGAPLVLQERWDPQRALELVDTYRCTVTAAATPFLKDLIDAPAPGGTVKLGPLRTFLCGGAAVPPLLVDQATAQFPHTTLTVIWGMTEGGVTSTTPDSTPAQMRTTVGCGLPGLELGIIDADGSMLGPDAEGELVMRGPGVFLGYLGQDELYAESLTADGYFRTGDLARLDDDGYVHLTGRLKDLIIRGGVNISPSVIEDALAGHPAVRRVAVVGQPDERMGERLCAVVVPAASATVSLDDLVRWVEQQGLPRRLWPEALQIVESMPVTAAGKIRKNHLRDQLFGSPT